MKEKLKKIDWARIHRVAFDLFFLVTVLSIYFSDRNGLVVITFFVVFAYNFYIQLEEFVKTYRINSNINIQRYLDERGLKKEEEK